MRHGDGVARQMADRQPSDCGGAFVPDRLALARGELAKEIVEAAITPVAPMELRALPAQPTRRFEQRHLTGGDETRVGGRQAMIVDDRLYARDHRPRTRDRKTTRLNSRH